MRLRCSYVAKSQSDRELESAALERALELNPSDSGTRFRIAYLYGEMENRRLAVYHYTLRLAQGPDSTALNNLGVSYRGLQLPGKEIAAFEKASEEDLLPKANLSHAYVDRGFLVKGEELANQVLHSNPEQIARERAVAVLDRISQIRLDEEQTLETIMNESKSERIFRSAYSFAFVDSLRNPIQGEFQTPHGKFVLKQESDELIGEGSYEEKQSSGLPLIFPGNRQANEIIKVTTLKFVAKIAGRSGTYKLHKKEVLKDNSWDVPKTETFQGLLVINEDGRSFDVLERNEKRFKCYTATKSYP